MGCVGAGRKAVVGATVVLSAQPTAGGRLHDARLGGRGPGYRTIKKAGNAVNKTIKQTKAAISISLPQCLATDEAFEDGVLTYDTRASGPKFNRPDHKR